MRKSARDLVLQMVNEETGVRGYMITTRRSSLRPYLLAPAARTADLRTLRSGAANDPAIVPLVTRAAAEVAALDRYFAHEIALVASAPRGVTAAKRRGRRRPVRSLRQHRCRDPRAGRPLHRPLATLAGQRRTRCHRGDRRAGARIRRHRRRPGLRHRPPKPGS